MALAIGVAEAVWHEGCFCKPEVSIRGFLAWEHNSVELSEQSLVCFWPGLTHKLTGSPLLSPGRQHRPGNSLGQFGSAIPFSRGGEVIEYYRLGNSKAVGFGSGELAKHVNALDPSKRSQDYCPMRVSTNLSSGALQ